MLRDVATAAAAAECYRLAVAEEGAGCQGGPE